MTKIQLFKKSFYLLLTVVTFLPVMTLSARGFGGGEGGGRGMGGDRGFGGEMGGGNRYQNTNPYERGYEEHRMNQDLNNFDEGYGGYGGYGSYGGYVDPYNAGQPGMSDDSNALYDSYLQSNQPQS